ncbi:MAG TPA: hypothetical protein VE870_05310 [Bacteroidales bacterium]|nr:hypothetical protein [Bacteroidales bacterium]
MNTSYHRSLKVIFLVNAILGGIVGIQHIIIPQLTGNLANVNLPSPILYRLVGAAVFSFAFASGLAYREKKRENVRIVVWMQVSWSFLGAVIIALGILAGKLPSIEWPNAILLFIFAIAFTWSWYLK